jgi:hypothetical protein
MAKINRSSQQISSKSNISSQVRSIAEVIKAVALGDLSKQIEVDARGEILDLKNCQWNGGQITSACGQCHPCHFGSWKSRKIGRSSTCTGRGRGMVKSGSECKCFFCVFQSKSLDPFPF